MFFYLFEVLFHLLTDVDIDQLEDQHSFLIHLYLIFVFLIVYSVLLFVLIDFLVVDEFAQFVIFVDVDVKVHFDVSESFSE